MAIDINAIRRKLGSLQTQNNKTSLLWKPSPGVNTIRIVPYQFNKENPFIELYFHYDLGKKNYLSNVTFGEDPDYGDVTDLTGGRDIKVTFTPPEGQEKWPKTAIMVKPNQTPATEDKNIAEKVVNGQSEIYEVYRKSSYEDLKAALEEWLGEGGEESTQPKAQPVAANATATNDNIDKAFDDLFNQ